MFNLLGVVENWERARVEDMTKTEKKDERGKDRRVGSRQSLTSPVATQWERGQGPAPAAKGKGIKDHHFVSVCVCVCVFASGEGDTHPTQLTYYKLNYLVIASKTLSPPDCIKK